MCCIGDKEALKIKYEALVEEKLRVAREKKNKRDKKKVEVKEKVEAEEEEKDSDDEYVNVLD